MRLTDQINRKPCFVAFGQAMSGGGITSVDLAANRTATDVTLTASDGSAAPIAGADATTAGVLTAADKVKLDDLASATVKDFTTRAQAAAATVAPAVTHLRTAGYAAAGDGGGALYARVGAQPGHALFLQSADGAFWELVPVDGAVNVRQAGAVGDGIADDYQAFLDVIEAFPSNVTLENRGSARLIVPPGTHFIGATLNVHSTVIIEGQGAGAADGGASVLVWPADTTGIVIQRMNTIGETTEVPNDTATKGGDGTIIRNLRLTGSGSFGAAADGIRLRARATIEECVIIGFPRDGVHISAVAGGGGSGEGNANQWRIHNSRIMFNKRTGIFVDGADSNAGIATSVDSSNNGRWGFFDSSFLGNTYVGCHAAANGVAGTAGNTGSSFVHYNGPENGNTDVRYAANIAASEADLVTTVPGTDPGVWMEIAGLGVSPEHPTWLPGQPEGTYFHGGAYATDNLNARNLFLGCYTESGQSPAQITWPTQVFGGTQGAGVTGSGLALDGNKITLGNLHLGPRDDDTTSGIELDLRRFSDSLVYANVSGDHPSGTQFLSWNDISKTWAIGKHGNLQGRIAAEITTDLTTLPFGRSAAPGGGYPYLGRGMFLGPGLNARHLTYGAAAPSSGDFAQGDVALNISPTATGTLGWVCVAAGAPGTWEPLAVVTKSAWDDLQARVTALESA